MTQLEHIEAVVLSFGKILKETGQTSIKRISNCMDDPCMGEKMKNKTHILKVQRMLIYHSFIAHNINNPCNPLQILFSEHTISLCGHA